MKENVDQRLKTNHHQQIPPLQMIRWKRKFEEDNMKKNDWKNGNEANS